MKRNRVLLSATVTLVTLGCIVTQAFAASSWSPTLLVNTEAFQVIDDLNTTSDVSIKFGNSLNKSLIYERNNLRFKFDAPLFVQGNLGATGTLSGKSLYVGQSFSGAGLTTCSNGSTDKLLWDSATQRFSCGSDQGGGGGGITQTAADARYVNQSGDTMTGNLVISNGGSLNASGAILTNGNLTINSDNGGQDAILTFGNTVAETLRLNTAADRFEFSDDVRVTGSITATGNLSGNTLTVSGISGNTFVLDGNSVVFDATNNRLGILNAAPETTLEATGTISGSVLRAQNKIEASGSLVVGGITINKASATQSITAASNTILANATVVVVDPNADYTMTSAPTIADGIPGQVVIVTAGNGETNKVILQDQDTLPSSNLQLGSTVREISGRKAITLRFDGTDWVERGYTTPAVDVQSFTSTGANTWTKPTGARVVYVVCVGGGGGGGGGTGGAAATARIGGGGGGGGAKAEKWFVASDLGATETATVANSGYGGNGGSSGAGSNGTAGGNSTFGSYLTCYGGGYGKGGIAATVSAGGGGGGTAGAGTNGAAATNLGGLPAATAGANGIAGQGGGGNIAAAAGNAEYGGGGGNGSSATPGAAGAGGSSIYGAGGGGGGGGITTANAAQTAGAGGNVASFANGGGGAAGTGGASCTVGTAGTAGTSTKMGTGGGGGGANTASTGCVGGDGGALGGGGGGGGAGTTVGGKGGKGGRGEIRVYTFF